MMGKMDGWMDGWMVDKKGYEYVGKRRREDKKNGIRQSRPSRGKILTGEGF